MTPTWTVILGQLVGQLPVLLVYLGGIVLCAVWSRRAPRAAMLAMLGCGILLLTTVGMAFAQTYVINSRGARPIASISQMMMVIGVGGSILRAGGIALLLAGVFAGRPRVAEQGGGFEVRPY